MKRLIFCFTFFYSASSFAQSGEVNYTRTISFGEIEVDGIPAELAAMMPKEDKADYVLYFSPQASMYESAPQQEKETKEMSGEGFRIRIETNEDQDKYYTDITNKKVVQQRELSGRLFLINDTQKECKWKMTGNQKKILDHVAMEAISITGKDTIEAWYAPDITVTTGPQGLAGLPGLILEATINKRQTIIASAINMNKDVSDKIKEPKKGKKATNEEFEKLAEAKAKERMQQMENGGGTTKQIMIVR